jgi:hypothetical protein
VLVGVTVISGDAYLENITEDLYSAVTTALADEVGTNASLMSI